MEEELEKRLWAIEEEIRSLSKQVFDYNKDRASELADLKKKIKSLNLKVGSITPYLDNAGRTHLRVTYLVENGDIFLNDDGLLESNEVFTQVNLLNLISYDDMKKLMAERDKLKKSKINV